MALRDGKDLLVSGQTQKVLETQPETGIRVATSPTSGKYYISGCNYIINY